MLCVFVVLLYIFLLILVNAFRHLFVLFSFIFFHFLLTWDLIYGFGESLHNIELLIQYQYNLSDGFSYINAHFHEVPHEYFFTIIIRIVGVFSRICFDNNDFF